MMVDQRINVMDAAVQQQQHSSAATATQHYRRPMASSNGRSKMTNAYLQHLQSKQRNSTPAYRQQQQPRMLSAALGNGGGGGGGGGDSGNTSSSGLATSSPLSSKIPVWKQRQIRRAASHGFETQRPRGHGGGGGGGNGVSASSFFRNRLDQVVEEEPSRHGPPVLGTDATYISSSSESNAHHDFDDSNGSLVGNGGAAAAAAAAAAVLTTEHLHDASLQQPRLSNERALVCSDSIQDLGVYYDDIAESMDETTTDLESTSRGGFARNDTFLGDEASTAAPQQDPLLKMIDETAARWSAQCQQDAVDSAAAVVLPAASPAAAPPSMALTVMDKDTVIEHQQAQIEALRRHLEELQYQSTSSPSAPPMQAYEVDANQQQAPMSPLPPQQWHQEMEQIDHVPVEHIQVWTDDDHMSVTSGLTNLHNDMSRMVDDASMADWIMAVPPLAFRPDVEELDNDCPPTVQRVSQWPLELRAQNGAYVKAFYTGPMIASTCTGIGTLQFASGDVYVGHVVDGAMHGIGTYTFAKSRKSSCACLSGKFEDNVYVGDHQQPNHKAR